MNWSFLLNRYGITFGAIAVMAGLWNVYIAFNNQGIIMGKVVGPDGKPAAGATVSLSEKSLLVSRPCGKTRTDADGKFIFTGHDCYRAFVEADKQGIGAFKKEYRLYFRGQNKTLPEPLRLKAASGG